MKKAGCTALIDSQLIQVFSLRWAFCHALCVFPILSHRILKRHLLEGWDLIKITFIHQDIFMENWAFCWFGLLWMEYVAMKNITPWCLSWCQHKVPAISPTIANVNTMKEGKNVLVLLSKLYDFVQPQEEVLGTEGDAQNIILEPWMYKFTSKLLGLCMKTVHVFPLPAFLVHFHPSPSIHAPYRLIPNSLHVFCFCIFPHVAPSA